MHNALQPILGPAFYDLAVPPILAVDAEDQAALAGAGPMPLTSNLTRLTRACPSETPVERCPHRP
jgi:hypothetical protein